MQAVCPRHQLTLAVATVTMFLLSVLGLFQTSIAFGQEETIPSAWFSADYSLRHMEGRPAPELRVAEWVGPSRSLHQMRGQIVVLHFWAMWCPYSIPPLRLDAETARIYAEKGVEIVAIHDGNNHGNGKWKRVAAEHGVKFSHALDLADGESSTTARYRVKAFSTYFVIDRAGIVRAAGIRPSRVRDVVDQLLGEESVPIMRSEFPPEFFVGREYRPTSLKGIEAEPAPQLQADSWINGETDIHNGGEIMLIQFFSPGDPKSLDALEGLAARQADLLSMGARLVAVASSTSDWETVHDLAKERSWTFPVMYDQRMNNSFSYNQIDGAIGRTGDAYSLGPLLPSVIVDRRGVIRAAGFRWEKASDIVRHIAMHPEVTPYVALTETPSP